MYYAKIGLALADDEKKVKSSYVFFHCAEYRQLIGVLTVCTRTELQPISFCRLHNCIRMLYWAIFSDYLLLHVFIWNIAYSFIVQTLDTNVVLYYGWWPKFYSYAIKVLEI